MVPCATVLALVWAVVLVCTTAEQDRAALLEQPAGKCEYLREAGEVLQRLEAAPTEVTVCLNGTDGCDITLRIASTTHINAAKI